MAHIQFIQDICFVRSRLWVYGVKLQLHMLMCLRFACRFVFEKLVPIDNCNINNHLWDTESMIHRKPRLFQSLISVSGFGLYSIWIEWILLINPLLALHFCYILMWINYSEFFISTYHSDYKLWLCQEYTHPSNSIAPLAICFHMLSSSSFLA